VDVDRRHDRRVEAAAERDPRVRQRLFVAAQVAADEADVLVDLRCAEGVPAHPLTSHAYRLLALAQRPQGLHEHPRRVLAARSGIDGPTREVLRPHDVVPLEGCVGGHVQHAPAQAAGLDAFHPFKYSRMAPLFQEMLQPALIGQQAQQICDSRKHGRREG
jgi:hypothetical protein